MTAVVIPTRCVSTEMLRRCVDSVKRYSPEVNIYVSASGDGPFPIGHGRVSVFSTGTPLTFAQATNAALRLIPQAEDVVLLNDDAEASSGWLSRLQRAATHPWWPHELAAYDTYVPAHLKPFVGRPPGLAGPITDNASGFQGGYVDSFPLGVKRWYAKRLVFFCAYITAEARQKIGLLDEQFENAFEDDDYCHRAVAVGFLPAVDPSCHVPHKAHSTFRALDPTGRDFNAALVENQRRFANKWDAPPSTPPDGGGLGVPLP